MIRHSGARRCTVVLGEHEVEVRDDGQRCRDVPAPATASPACASGPRPLGGTVVTRSLDPGFSLKVVVP